MSKYEALRKTARNKEIVSYAKKHPELSYVEIGEVFGGLTKGSICQILQKVGAGRRTKC